MLDEQINRLLDEIDRVKSEIKKFKTSLGRSGPYEDQTRGILIDQMLRALGWNMGDSSQVYRQYPIGGGRVDYALIDVDQKPVAIVEAKSLNKPLDDEHRKQVASYAKNIRRGLSVLTNGDKWELYDNTRRRVKFDHRRILTVSIAEQSSLQCAVPLLQLWRSYLVPGQPAPSAVPASDSRPTSLATDAPSPQDRDWIPLSRFSLKSDTRDPKKVRLPNGEERKVEGWRKVLIEVAEWLVRDGALAGPIQADRARSSYLVNSRPRHSRRAFRRSHKLRDDLYLDTDAGSDVIIKKSKQLLQGCGKDPASIHVQVSLFSHSKRYRL